MALTFPEPQRPGKTWDLHVIVQCLLEQSGEGFILFYFIFFPRSGKPEQQNPHL